MSLHVEGPKVSWFTSQSDGREHAVRDESYALARNFGIDPGTVCGAVLLPMSLGQHPGRRCARCVGYVRAASTVTSQVVAYRRPRVSLWQALRRLFTLSPWPVRGELLRHPPAERSGPATVAPPSPPSGATVPRPTA